MPTYQYRCTSCGEDLEVFQKFTDASLTECPSCTGELRKVFNAVGVVFKGSGFYATDSRKQQTSSTPASTPASGTSEGSSSPSAPSTSGTSSTSSAPAAASTSNS